MSRKENLPKCTFHPDITAVKKCVNCGRPFCNLCLEETKKQAGLRCVECLKAREFKQRSSIRKYIILYIVGFAASSILAVVGFLGNQPPFLATFFASAFLGENWWIFVVANWMQSKLPEPIIYMAIVASIGFLAFAAFDIRATVRLRRSLPEHGFCPKCGSVLFGKSACPNCGKEILISPPAYPDIVWLRQYLRMKEKVAVDYEKELEKKKKVLRTKYRGRRKRMAEPEK